MCCDRSAFQATGLPYARLLYLNRASNAHRARRCNHGMFAGG
jgi:hypothetical protein